MDDHRAGPPNQGRPASRVLTRFVHFAEPVCKKVPARYREGEYVELRRLAFRLLSLPRVNPSENAMVTSNLPFDEWT